MGLGELKKKIGTKIAEKATENLAAKADSGGFGPRVQAVYRATKGYKTTIGAVLFIITAAVAEYGPEWSTDYARISAVVFMGLGWAGLVDRARRNEPIFEPWLLAAIAQTSAAFAAVSALLLGVAQSGILAIVLPGDPCAADYLTVASTFAGSLALFFQRVTKASALAPTPTVPPTSKDK